ncbi:MAG TPA: tetratricopeptide repeat protein [Thermoanaerobaculia bacterium]|nr:tetratricopeptide repeat protein [Thermoanaerobaculia bacterium]
MISTRPIAVFFAFANDRAERGRYLRNLPDEQRHVREAMAAAVEAGLCEVVERANATVDEVLDVFQDLQYRDRIAVFHFGGHAGDAELLLESASGEATVAHAGGLARFLGQQRGLELVFLNGCSSRGQVQGLLDAGVPAVIATSQAIDDAVATEFSSRFYKAFASGAAIRTAYAEAQGAVQTRRGDLARGTYRSFVPDVVAEDRWPWDLYVASGAEERLARWSLPLAARDPLFGLPPLPPMDLPASPFKHLAWFGREDAQIFFGRGREIRDLYEAVTLPEAEPIVLLFGATGAGKSSLLAAGLAPRLEATHEVRYLRRDGTRGLAGTLAQELGDPGAGGDLGAVWRAREAATGKPLVIILDQAEEAWTRPLAQGKEAEELAAALRSIFGVREKRPRGRLILGFRKEWLAEMLRLVDGQGLPRFRVEVTHLDRDAIAEAIAGPAKTESLRRYYRLEVEPGLPEIIADDLLEDPGAAIAPALQILLTKTWALATQENPEAPRFTVELYRRLKRGGILLDDFLGEQLESLRQARPEPSESGLVLDLLTYLTTALGTAETRQISDVVARYGGRPEIAELLRQCQDRYLLSLTNETSRLAHDTLAPLVRRRFEASDLPGQRALRIIEQRGVEWAGGKQGPPLDEVDLTTVEKGSEGLRAWTADETRLVERSRAERARRRSRQRNLRWAAMLAVAAVLASAGAAWRQAVRAEKEARSAGRVTDFLADMFQTLDPYRMALSENGLPQILDRSQASIEKSLAEEPKAQDRLRETIGVVNLNLGRLPQAEALLHNVVTFRREKLGEEHLDTLTAKNELANVYLAQARRKEAEELYHQVLESRQSQLGEEHPKTLQSMSNLATVWRDQGRWKEAEKLNNQVLEIALRVHRERHPDTLKIMNNQANLYAMQGRFQEAENLARRVLDLRREVLKENDPDTLASMTSVANVVADLGRLKEAEDLDREALRISEKAMGPEHPDTLMYRMNLANVLYQQSRLDEAATMHREILAVYSKVQGKNHPDTVAEMSNLASVLKDQKHLKDAEALLRKAYGISSRTRGPKHPDTLAMMGNLASVLQAQGRLDEAEDLQRQTLALRSEVLGKEHPETLLTMSNLALLVAERGRLKEAEGLLQETIAAMSRQLGDESLYTRSVMDSLAAVYQAEGRLKEAEELRRKSSAKIH